MAGSSGYDSEFYTTDKTGKVQRNPRTMKLQGMDPKKRIADSSTNEKRINERQREDFFMSDRDKARMKAVKGDEGAGTGGYNEDEFQTSVVNDDLNKRRNAFDRGYSASVDMQKQKRQGELNKKFPDNSFKPFTTNVPTLSKQIMAENAKKKR